ncbi:EGF domain-specific O-linked N-acetylglucosamine transferase isoform X2 [Nilaparvata lugens]|uniref:EGF domain-specific O-linked N-acetylglucosamine transferase isoform X2 n=1 Tax=Nilaparvata lugens TaxID=108931 RepID=UPI00193D09BB|nr:EGF domain-specific O-linked N-acetylglucosamine transferase isoform X2 [Nilaparvata lugens]
MEYFLIIFIFLAPIECKTSFDFNSINLPREHLKYYFNTFTKIGEDCINDENCRFKKEVEKQGCWGYEMGCKEDTAYSKPQCLGDHKGWVKTKADQINTFYTQADFGYIREQQKEMTVMCEPLFKEDSSLECSKYLRFCRGRNLMINFTDLMDRKEPLRYKMDVLKDGQIGGYCTFYEDRLKDECTHISPLQSWGPEMRYFKRLDKRPIVSGDCDIVIEKPTFIMKIDAINMYHHFCDFFNLYMSQHLNLSQPDGFSTDVHILIWESFSYFSNFASAFEAFTEHPIWDLKTFKGKTVCFRNVVFPLLPRMIFGLYYNTPIIWGCEKSGLFHAFSKHILHRLKIPEKKRKSAKIRITLLSRNTDYRNILNENELIEALEKNSNYQVRRVIFNRSVDFKKQLEVVRNTDLFIGMHGAGLTHLLFLPDWAVVFELYNCEDENCYMDLARLRGVKYITWQDKSKLEQQDEGKHPDGGAHAKFTNYKFDVEEFMRLIVNAEEYITSHKKFKKLNKKVEGLKTAHDEL